MQRSVCSTMLLCLAAACCGTACCAADETPKQAVARPSMEQAAWHDDEIGMFIHFGPATWQDSEYDTLATPLDAINPEKLDTDQWVAVAEAMGAQYIVFVAKHTGGFCWWSTDTTDYSVKHTAWRGGKGDVLKDLAQSCQRRGMKLGVYLSPADAKFGAGVGGRCVKPEDQMRYEQVYRQQLTELLTQYGSMYEVWFDGSLIFDVGDLLRNTPPKAMVFQGPQATIRWVGNEGGYAPYPAWNGLSQVAARSGIATAADGDPNGDAWLPNECDTTMRAGWFWKSTNAHTLRSLKQLLDVYYRSVGHGAVLLLNNTPDTSGLIPEADAKRSAEFGAEIKRRFGTSLAETKGEGAVVELDLGRPTRIDTAITMEQITEGERIREYVLEGCSGGKWTRLTGGTAIGHKKIDRFRVAEVTKVRLRVLQAVEKPLVRRLAVYCVRGEIQTLDAPSVGPVGAWAFEEVRDEKVLDDSGRAWQGQVHNVGLGEGRGGQALAFNGRDSAVFLGRAAVFRGDFSIAAWICPRSGSTGQRTIVSKERINVASFQCRFYLAADNRLGFMLNGEGDEGLWPFESAAAAVPESVWSHVAVTRQGDRFTLFVHGQPVGQKSVAEMLEHENDDDVMVGAIRNANTDQLGNVFDGTIDAVRVYNRGLSADEVLAIAEDKSPWPTGGGSVVWEWKSDTLGPDWKTIEIDIAPACKDACQYEVEFRPTGGQPGLEVQSMTLLVDGREAGEFVQRSPDASKFYVTITGLGVPLQLRVVARVSGGTDAHGQAVIRRRG